MKNDTSPAIAFPALLERCSGQADFALELLTDFSEVLPSRVAAVKTAVESGATLQAEYAAHALKGAAETVGAESVGDLAALIESAAGSDQLPSAKAAVDELDGETERYLQELARIVEKRVDAPPALSRI